jgi:2,4-dienoyl-CoA reductase-like NADH-dependent reductase (Old Yellow Enzyme family)
MLFDPLKIRDVVLRNRIVVSPMCQYSAQDGVANDWHLVHLGSRAVGGAGLIFTEATAVEARGRISPYDLGLWKDEHIGAFERIVKFIHAQGAVAGVQLAHSGRKGSTARPWEGHAPVDASKGGWPVVAPSAVAFDRGYPVPKELTMEEIKRIVDLFAQAAERARRAGFKIAEVHSAHGYLLHEFLSPVSNKRDDQYGGPFKNRIRLLLEVVRAVRAVWPDDLPVFVRISATDWLKKEGWDVEEAVALARLLKNEGVSVIDCSSGGLVPYAPMPTAPGFQVPFAERIRKDAGILTGAVGMITEPRQAEDMLTAGRADLIFLGRRFLRDPYWPLHAQAELNQKISWPPQYERAH